MAEFYTMHGWLNHPTPTRPKVNRFRSLSSTSAPKSDSSTATPTMADVAFAPGLPRSRQLSAFSNDAEDMSTIPDPRSRAMTPASDHSPSSSSPHHPDLSSEIATLSNKLITAINYQTSLDDALSATRHELEESRARAKLLETKVEEHASLLSRGELIPRHLAEAEKQKLQTALVGEQKRRGEVEKEKRSIEQELENLTTALFEEANKMVITSREASRKDNEALQKKNDQLKAQLEDTETLLRSHQEQLAELKQVMEHMNAERDDRTDPTAPSTPAFAHMDPKDEGQLPDSVRQSVDFCGLEPSYPTSFTHLVHPILRTDIAAYDDFMLLCRMSKSVVPGSRTSSGSYGGLGGLGLGLGAYAPSLGQSPSVVSLNSEGPRNNSVYSLSNGGSLSSAPGTPNTPATSTLAPLKETKFYKRALSEDIEPTLRLDTAPGLSWLARRSVLTAMCEGTMVVEPMPTSSGKFRLLNHACSLCGETRNDPSHLRTHRFRTSESDSAQRYPLCKFCLGRVRSTCDFLGFLRLLREGHWRTDDEMGEKLAWEESVRLREQMFWCRMGGGVLPGPAPSAHSNDVASSSRSSEEQEEEARLNEELERTGTLQAKDVTPTPTPTTPSAFTRTVEGNREPYQFNRKRLVKKIFVGGSGATRFDTADGLWQAAQDDAAVPASPPNTDADDASKRAIEPAEISPLTRSEGSEADEQSSPGGGQTSPNIVLKSPTQSTTVENSSSDSYQSSSSQIEHPTDPQKGESEKSEWTMPGSFE